MDLFCVPGGGFRTPRRNRKIFLEDSLATVETFDCGAIICFRRKKKKKTQNFPRTKETLHFRILGLFSSEYVTKVKGSSMKSSSGIGDRHCCEDFALSGFVFALEQSCARSFHTVLLPGSP